MPSTEPVRVTIFNQTYTVSAVEGDADIHELAHTVDELMRNISRSGNFDATRTAVLACLHLADQLRTAQHQLDELKVEVQNKAKDFALRLETVIGE